MPSEPTREELLAQVAALQNELARTQGQPSLFPKEVSGVATAAQPTLKTTQQVVRSPPFAVPRDLLLRASARSTDPNVIQSQIDALQTVITSGVNSAGYGDKRTEFRSLNELRQILFDLQEQLETALGGGGRIRQIRMTTQADKGL